MYCTAAVRAWVCWVSAGSEVCRVWVTSLAGCEETAVTQQPRYWLTESLVTSHRSITTLCGGESACKVAATEFTSSRDRNQPNKPTEQRCSFLSVHSWFLCKCFNALQTCEGRSYDFYNYVSERRSLLCCNIWWGAARPDSLLITCQRHVKSNMGPFTPGTRCVKPSLRCVIRIMSLWHAGRDVCGCDGENGGWT